MKEEPSWQLVREVEEGNTIDVNNRRSTANTISKQHAFSMTAYGYIGDAVIFRVLGPKGGQKSVTWMTEKDLANLRDAINELLEQQEGKLDG